MSSGPVIAAGTAVGTVIENTANITYDLGGTPLALQSNTTTIVVAERINVTTTLQSPQTLVSANDSNQALLFTVTNTGNGSEAFQLAIDSALGGDDFDPLPAVPAIYFDTDGSGDFNAGDIAYSAGSNDPLLSADESINVFIVNDIPGTVSNGQIGRSQLTATAVTGSGPAGTVYAGQGDGGVDAVIGTTTGTAAAIGEYLVSDVLIDVIKSQLVNDPNGGNQPIPGATLTLPGMAGIVLTVGMAVDANVLIFERIREEIRAKRSPQQAIHHGYDSALSTIADANITTLIAAIILFAVGNGPVKGFAITLAIGIITSMFTAIVGTRAIVNSVWGGKRLSKLSI